MLLGNLIRNTTVQGNVRLSVWKGNEETAVEYFHNVDDLANEPCRLMAWLPIKYIFCPGDGYLHIELDGDEK